MAEDAQPNESRLSRKGNTRIPLVRAAAPTRARPFARRTFSNRGEHAQNRFPSAILNSQPPSSYADRRFVAGPSSPANWRSQRGYNADRTRAWAPTAHFAAKRQKLDGGKQNPRPWQSQPTRDGQMDISLPPECRRGAFNSQQSRQGWITRETARLRKDHRVAVKRHEVLGTFVRFYHTPLPSEDMTSLVKQNPNKVPIGKLDVLTSHISGPLELTGKSKSSISNKDYHVIGNHVPPYTSHTTVISHDRPSVHLKRRREDERESSNSASHEMLELQAASKGSNSSHAFQKPVLDMKPSYSKESYSDTTVRLGETYGDPIDLTADEMLPQSLSSKPANALFPNNDGNVEVISARCPVKFRSGRVTIRPVHTSLAVKADTSCSALREQSFPRSLERRQPPESDALDLQDVTPARDVSASCNGRDRDDASPHPGTTSGGDSSVSRPQYTMTGTANATTGMLLSRRQVSPQETKCNGLAEIISLQKDRRDKPRRIFKHTNSGVLTTISLHGFVDSVETSSRRRRKTIFAPSTPSGELIDDACMVSLPSGPHAILGHARERQQISLLGLSTCDSQIHHYDKPKSAGMRSGVSAVCAMMMPLMFASGGHDHNIHLWQIKEDSLAASATRLDIKHTSVVQSLVPIHDTSHKLISAGADCNVHLYDLSSERVVRTMKTSNSVYQTHVAASPYTVLLEVAHRELQFELRDYRVVPRNAVQRFGYHDPKVNGRFARGDLRENHFVCGDNDGRVRLWDTRNTKHQVSIMDIFDGQKVVQVLFDESTFVAASEHNQLAFFANPIA